MICVIISILGFIVCSITDIKNKKIYIIPCSAMIVSGLVVNFIIENKEWKEFIPGIGLGLLFLLISFIKSNAMGKGDGLMILALGCLIKGDKVFQMVFLSLLFVILFSMPGAVKKKIKLKSQLPFIPFLFAGEIVVLAIERII